MASEYGGGLMKTPAYSFKKVPILLFAILLAHWSQAAEVKQLSAENLLDPETINALKYARSQGYDVQILRNSANAKLVILLGESHYFNSDATTQAGKKVCRNLTCEAWAMVLNLRATPRIQWM
jgi:hypothetical protein